MIFNPSLDNFFLIFCIMNGFIFCFHGRRVWHCTFLSLFLFIFMIIIIFSFFLSKNTNGNLTFEYLFTDNETVVLTKFVIFRKDSYFLRFVKRDRRICLSWQKILFERKMNWCTCLYTLHTLSSPIWFAEWKW